MSHPIKRLPEFDLQGSETVYDYVMSNAFVCGIKGPVGSGKSVGSCIKILRHAGEYAIDRQGYRRSRVGVIRNTYPELRSTTIKTWEDIFTGYRAPPIIQSAPIRHHLKIHPVGFKWLDWDQGTYEGRPGLDLEVWFLALDKPRDVAHLKSLELSFAFINEASEVSPAIVDMLTARVGRYPKAGDMRGRPFVGIFYDTNAADETVWTEDYEANTPPNIEVELEDGTTFVADWEFHTQPMAVIEVDNQNEICETGHPRYGEEIPEQRVMFSAGRFWTVNPIAENIQNLKPGYYQQQITNKTLDWIQRYLQAKRVYIADGQPWVPEFNQTTMVRRLKYNPDLDLMAGIDAGGGTLNPAAVWGQVSPFGGWHILHELVIQDIGFERFLDAFARAHAQKFPGVKLNAIYMDPAAGKRDEVYETAVIDYLRREEMPGVLAPTNDPKLRRQALARPMGRLVHLPNGEAVPGFLVDPSCPTFIAALAGKWYRKYIHRGGAQQAVDDKPLKNHPFSDVGDAGSYLCLGGGEIMGMGRDPSGPRGSLKKQAERHGGVIPSNFQIKVFDD